MIFCCSWRVHNDFADFGDYNYLRMYCSLAALLSMIAGWSWEDSLEKARKFLMVVSSKLMVVSVLVEAWGKLFLLWESRLVRFLPCSPMSMEKVLSVSRWRSEQAQWFLSALALLSLHLSNYFAFLLSSWLNSEMNDQRMEATSVWLLLVKCRVRFATPHTYSM